jgi:Amt family ammonium transporter
MLISTVIVLMMIIPGLALFYGGLVRAKNMVSILSQVFVVTAIGMVMWLLVGYSLAFTDGGGLNRFVGGLSKAFLNGVDTIFHAGRNLLRRNLHSRAGFRRCSR